MEQYNAFPLNNGNKFNKMYVLILVATKTNNVKHDYFSI